MSLVEQLVVGGVLAAWGLFVVSFPKIVIKWLLAAEKAGLAWNPQARWGAAWVRVLGSVLGLVGLVMLVTGLFGVHWR
ncbi:hypothetical protein P9139_14520 [Curtobacterium flaccumfaciens]|nr:hypothetical protein P9139_14520 [Curtobacterium flaccumfaciens]